MSKGILSGVRVLALEQQIAAPLATMLLGIHGAEIIKLERLTGDPKRLIEPQISTPKGIVNGDFIKYNHNKKSICMNFKTPEGMKILKELIAKSDVIVENLKPGSMDEIGLSYAEIQKIKPDIIYVAISGFGRMEEYKGPYTGRIAYDIVAQAMGGIMNRNRHKGGPPKNTNVAFGDVIPGLYATQAVLLGLLKRNQTGQGEYFDISMYECMVKAAEDEIYTYNLSGVLKNDGGPDPGMSPYQTYKCKDGYVALIIPDNIQWGRLCNAMNHPEWICERYKTGWERHRHMDELEQKIEDWMSDKTPEEVAQILIAGGVPCGPVQSVKDILECEHLKSRKFFETAPHPLMGEITMVGLPYKMKNHTPEYTAEPILGGETEYILSSVLGYTSEEISALEEKEVVKSKVVLFNEP